jgi:hypothetical protein
MRMDGRRRRRITIVIQSRLRRLAEGFSTERAGVPRVVAHGHSLAGFFLKAASAPVDPGQEKSQSCCNRGSAEPLSPLSLKARTFSYPMALSVLVGIERARAAMPVSGLAVA